MSAEGLTVRNLTVRYGGAVALDDVSIDAPVGEITGLIGPNGAGKSTLLNAVYGAAPVVKGQLSLFGRDLRRMRTDRRARVGMARTFQHMQLFDTLTVGENVAFGAEAGALGGNPLRYVLAGPQANRAVAQTRADAIEWCGLGELESANVTRLSTGQKRLVEFARALASPARMLLLDEPSSGLDRNETSRFAGVLRTAMQRREAGVLLVDHDMALISEVCTSVYVLDFGELIYAGPMAAARDDERVRRAYLGRSVDTAGAGETTEAGR